MGWNFQPNLVPQRMKDHSRLSKFHRNFDIAISRSVIDSSDLVDFNNALQRGKARARMKMV